MPSSAWKLMQLSHKRLSPERDNQEVVRFDSELKNVFPTFEAGSFNYKQDPVTGLRTNFRVPVDRAAQAYSLPKSIRDRNYWIGSSEFARTHFDVVLGSGVVSWVDRSWALDTDALRKAIVQTDLLNMARAFQAGDRTHANTPAPLMPMSLGEQVWLVVPWDSENQRFYFIPERFETASGNLIEAGSTLNVIIERKPVPLEMVSRVKAYGKRTIPGSQGVPTQYCAYMVFEVSSKPAIQDSTCSYDSKWRHSFLANSPSLGKVDATRVYGKMYTSQGQKWTTDNVVGLDNSAKWDIKILRSQEAAAAKQRLK